MLWNKQIELILYCEKFKFRAILFQKIDYNKFVVKFYRSLNYQRRSYFFFDFFIKALNGLIRAFDFRFIFLVSAMVSPSLQMKIKLELIHFTGELE